MLWLAVFSMAALALGRERLATGAEAAGAYGLATPQNDQNIGSFDPRDPTLLKGALGIEALSGLKPEAAAERAGAWLASLGSHDTKQPERLIASILPERSWFQARLMMERDEPTLRGDALSGGAFGQAYAEILASLSQSRSASPAFEAVLTAIWRDLELGSDLKPGPVAPLARKERWLPGTTSLSASHRYALDLFFTKVRRQGQEEIGPAVKSIATGIVVASADDWKGADKASLYKSGGLSPKAGNGLIIFNPDEGRYYAYFHLHDIKFRAGELVAAGQTLGHGGNTGINARKKGHGEHLHIEIHETDGSVWTSYQLKEFIALLP
ncbi:MAG TPA: hypothetical protein DCG47_12580 [Spirochaetaceae bacterium]|nr:hypothetical protein [Spirochaetaceae bacterium]